MRVICFEEKGGMFSLLSFSETERTRTAIVVNLVIDREMLCRGLPHVCRWRRGAPVKGGSQYHHLLMKGWDLSGPRGGGTTIRGLMGQVSMPPILSCAALRVSKPGSRVDFPSISVSLCTHVGVPTRFELPFFFSF
ncbi:hypothetical protein QYF36_001239 [Acer negundo]|nr:hypothetical protein QYF36_001239 [Acer negundo]